MRAKKHFIHSKSIPMSSYYLLRAQKIIHGMPYCTKFFEMHEEGYVAQTTCLV